MKKLLNYSCFIETDYERFDASISLEYLKNVEFLFLTMMFPYDEYPDYNIAMLRAQKTFGLNEIGLSYSISGTRCSGDAHTSIGNGLINHFNTWLCLSTLPKKSWVSYHEGDDGVIAVDLPYIDQAAYNLHLMPCLGFKLKMNKFNDVNAVSFCGRFLASDRDKLVDVCDILRTLSKIHTICSDGDPQSLTLAKMLSYYHSDGDTPIIGCLATVLIRLLHPQVSARRLTRALQHLKYDYWFRTKVRSADFDNIDFKFKDPTPCKRALVALRTGWSPGLQIAYENYYKSFLTLGFLPKIIHKLPHKWDFTVDSQMFGKVSEFVC